MTIRFLIQDDREAQRFHLHRDLEQVVQTLKLIEVLFSNSNIRIRTSVCVFALSQLVPQT